MPEYSAEDAEILAAVLVDYQNLFHYLKGRLPGSGSPGDTVAELLDGLRGYLLDEEDARIATGCAYADFAGLDDHVRHLQRALYLSGIQPTFVPSTSHRNTTDLQMAIDAVSLRERRPDVELFVLVAGDRDYVPVVQALQAHGRRVLVVAFRDHLSARLLEHTGAGRFVQAETLLPGPSRDQLLPDDRDHDKPDEHSEFNEPTDLPYPINHDVVNIIETYFGQYDEVYLTPLLRRLSEEFGALEDHDPKSLVADLEEAGAVRLERRKGNPYDYTVLLVNPEHPAVVAVREEGEATSGDGAAFSYESRAYDFAYDEQDVDELDDDDLGDDELDDDDDELDTDDELGDDDEPGGDYDDDEFDDDEFENEEDEADRA